MKISRNNVISLVVGFLLVLSWMLIYVERILWPVLAGYVVLLALTFILKLLRPFREAVIFLLSSFLIIQITKYIPYLGDWPLAMYAIGLGSYCVLKFTSEVDFSARWKFRFTRNEMISFAAIVIVSLVALVFYYRAYPEVAKSWPMPPIPAWAVPFVIVIAAAINGLSEELVYRFVFQRAMLKWNSPLFSILLQALAFGFLHFRNGFPQGWVGTILTTLFGLLVGAQYYFSRSMALAWLTHSVTDAVMFAIIVYI